MVVMPRKLQLMAALRMKSALVTKMRKQLDTTLMLLLAVRMLDADP